MEAYIKVKDKEIPIRIRNYQNTNRVKLYFKGDILQVSKPKYFSQLKLMKMIHKNEEAIYKQYCEIISYENDKIKHWYTGESILYTGERYCVVIKDTQESDVYIQIDEKSKQFQITVPRNLTGQKRKLQIDSAVKKQFKIQTEEMLLEKLPNWSKKTQIGYHDFKVRDTVSKYGSCVPKTKMLHFNARLIMLPEKQVDAIIVHELCHIVHPNHSQDFYQLVKQYLPDYDIRNQWLKKNQTQMML
ncbi:MAG: M48 family metallopeptidase [Clostridia bacterium]